MKATKATPLTVADLEAYYSLEHPDDETGCADWGGYGYLDARLNGLRTAESRVTMLAADQWVVDHANKEGWDVHVLHRFLNSKAGRWFADAVWNFDLDRAIKEFSRIPRKDWDQA